MAVLVVGGAGYIGSVAVRHLLDAGVDVAVVDNLATGHKEALDPRARFYELDLRDRAKLGAVFETEKIEAVIHFAAASLVAESVAKPLYYFNNNTYGMLVLLETMAEHNVTKIVFSSTAAVYGLAGGVPLPETAPTSPINPYGQSKLMMEEMMHWQSRAAGISYVALRYFNAAGSAYGLGEDHQPETHLLPLVIKAALGQREKIAVYGTDYATTDGSCIRDYIHVLDLARAHHLALEYLQAGGESMACNLGTGRGYSVLEIIETTKRVLGCEISVEYAARRPGDPAILVADVARAKELLGFIAEHSTLDEIIATAGEFHANNPQGYRS